MPVILEIKKLYFAYGAHEVLRDVSLDIGRGEIVGILGPNGAGKSTLINLMCGNLKPKSGEIIFEGKSLGDMPTKVRAQNMAVVPQSSFAPFAFTSIEMVLMGRTPYLSPLGFESKDDIDIAIQAMKKTDCDHLASRGIGELSGGERQRVILARAIAQKPRVLILDEPTTFLDIRHTSDLRNTLRDLNSNEGMTTILALHDLNIASSICGRLILIKDGRAVIDGAPGDILTRDTIEMVFDAKVHIATDPQTNLPYCLL